MSNLNDNNSFKSSINVKPLNKSMELNTTNQRELFSDMNKRFESSFVGNKTISGRLTGMMPRQSSVNSQMNQLFKISNFDTLPVKKATVRSLCSPSRRVQTGRVKNDLKQSYKLSLIPRPSFINSRKSLHSSRSSQLNARKELIKKMVILAEACLKEKQTETVKQTAPVKVLAGLTPKKTPRTGSYFIIPEFNKKAPKLDEIRAPIEEFVKKEVFGHSAKSRTVVKPIEIPVLTPKEMTPNTKEVTVSPDRRFTTILSQCKVYKEKAKQIHEKIKLLDDSLEEKIKSTPQYRIYNEFCLYQIKKEEVYKQLQALETDLRDFVSTQTKVAVKLKAYMRKKQEFLEMQMSLHENFEQALQSVMGKQKEDKIAVEEEKPKVETPKLRRSIRLSKIKKNKLEERTPMSKKLKKLDSKSKGIQKSGKVRSP